MYHHAVFALYSLSFMALFCSLMFLLNFAGAGMLVFTLVCVVPPLHMFRQLRATFGQGGWLPSGALARCCFQGRWSCSLTSCSSSR